ncbi:MAG: hypothetical protein WAO78_16775 [Roseovarius sp.]
MTVIIEKPAINLREELADLRNQGTYQEQQFYFDGLVTNGTFDADVSGWVLYNGATIAWDAGRIKATKTGSYGGFGQEITGLVVGKVYKLTAQVEVVNFNAALVWISTTLGGAVSASQTISGAGVKDYEFSFTATQQTMWITVRGEVVTGTGNVYGDNISVFELDANDDVIHTMPKGWVPKDVFEDGLLQREGAANDYTVVYDGFDYYVKPAVAPSATTTTCVIGVRK